MKKIISQKEFENHEMKKKFVGAHILVEINFVEKFGIKKFLKRKF